ncbi:sensor histidine kinase [Aureitalea marina]|uniref:histidine kinase n=1 Tax=Aureitalea marina TaxID=930804 RepID=A0A2S7KT48_9FLAO|nr:HAMP domain-containing sensor histidine kinase [Aureitalea marina]PQB05805.1 two-component sensor histidine kinase [Aureitalea marina]
MQNRTAITRWIFILGSILIISLILWNTYQFFNQLKENERSKMELWAAAQSEFEQTDLSSDEGISDMVLQVLRSNSTTPMILKSAEGDYVDRNLYKSNVSDTTAYLENLIVRFESENQPINLSYVDPANGNNVQIGTLYYGNSDLLNKLKYYPAALILIIFLFFVAIYFFYKTSRSAEQNKLWAGMAKETAHQIGTPLSSLVGWAEILKQEGVKPEYITEIEKDISRLRTITDRFSKVGSKPVLERCDVVEVTSEVYDYLKSRSSKLIEFDLQIPDHPVMVMLNPQLYGWTIENLVKNGIDAMKGKGKISIGIRDNGSQALIDIADTGVGIPKRDQKKVFSPGFTTKTRGWGLGLSLARRIINEYHNGRIHVMKSSRNEGTTMEIILKKVD